MTVHPDDLDPGPDPEFLDELRTLWRRAEALVERMDAAGDAQAEHVERASALLATALWAGIEADAPTDHG